MTQNKKSALFDILKREKLEKLVKGNRNSASKAAAAKETQKTTGSESLEEKTAAPAEKKEGQGTKIYKAMDEIKLDIRYYFLEDEYKEKIAGIYNKNEGHLDRLGIDPRKYLDYARETFDRFKQLNKKMPLEPMNKKSWEYVEKSLNELIVKLLEKFVK
ncbi:LIC11177 family protein [Leptospira adleri]|uniref:Uncharacterized protein n=1 Tax=Leptospira adleri TaxID=2023186 RepID=A0A2M9YTS3_9LEPT|nr:hypothetical protein [Leptospira adleri]PJZ54924.1 hypothetical protein CH380_02930 [Leptospira adleri]PJZ60846.1 hypothetical protein CH376_16350 [Leptospira adleri]TGM57762.1 hypothetical protein EHQ97_08725 [Leptospira adleri]